MAIIKATKKPERPETAEAIQWTGENKTDVFMFLEGRNAEGLPIISQVPEGAFFVDSGVRVEIHSPEKFYSTYNTDPVKESEWISVGVNLPANNETEINGSHFACDVNVFNGDVHPAIFSCGYSCGHDFWWAFHADGVDITSSVTHWMPLPKPPVTESKL